MRPWRKFIHLPAQPLFLFSQTWSYRLLRAGPFQQPSSLCHHTALEEYPHASPSSSHNMFAFISSMTPSPLDASKSPWDSTTLFRSGKMSGDVSEAGIEQKTRCFLVVSGTPQRENFHRSEPKVDMQKRRDSAMEPESTYLQFQILRRKGNPFALRGRPPCS